jgi:NADPH:quinone reductase-like Zn-dependent oxidoreductase
MTISTGAKTMKALRFTEFVSSSVSRFGGISIPEPREGEALIHVKAAAINPSDVGNVAGRFNNDTTLSRTPGRDSARIVVKGKQHEGQRGLGGVARVSASSM